VKKVIIAFAVAILTATAAEAADRDQLARYLGQTAASIIASGGGVTDSERSLAMSGEFAEEVAIPAFGVALWGLPEEDFAILESGSTNPAVEAALATAVSGITAECKRRAGR
jgi:hypothetical protein